MMNRIWRSSWFATIEWIASTEDDVAVVGQIESKSGIVMLDIV